MRKLKLFAFALLIGTTTLFANHINPEDSTKEMRNQIVALMNAPNLNINQEITVIITFTFNSVGEIIVLKVNSKDSEVLNYLRQNLNQKAISSPGEKFKQYTIPLTIRK